MFGVSNRISRPPGLAFSARFPLPPTLLLSAMGERAPASSGFRTEPLGGTLVWQCANCRVVFGDTYGFVCANEELRTITLKAASNIVVDEAEPRTSAEGIDASSTYFAIRCKSCDSMVGKFYRATPRSLDVLRDSFSFSHDALITYTLGHNELTVEDEEDGGGDAAAAGTANGDGGATLENVVEAIKSVEGQVAELDKQHMKTMNILLLYSERLENLETLLDVAHPAPQAGGATAGDDTKGPTAAGAGGGADTAKGDGKRAAKRHKR